MPTSINVLVFPCGKENALEVHNALNSTLNVRVFGASSVDDHGELVYESYIGRVPFIKDSDFLSKFNDLLVKHAIDVVIPTHDSVALALAAIRHQLAARLASPSLEATEICRNKSLTYHRLARHDFIADWGLNARPSSASFPIFAKPDVGEGAKNTRLIQSYVLASCLEYRMRGDPLNSKSSHVSKEGNTVSNTVPKTVSKRSMARSMMAPVAEPVATTVTDGYTKPTTMGGGWIRAGKAREAGKAKKFNDLM